MLQMTVKLFATTNFRIVWTKHPPNPIDVAPLRAGRFHVCGGLACDLKHSFANTCLLAL